MTNKTRIDVMIELETLGTDFNAPIFQIAAAGFDIASGDIILTFDECASMQGWTRHDWTISGSTLKWWLDTKPAQLAKLLGQGDLTPCDLLEMFHRWLDDLTMKYDEVYLWGNGILFDNAIIRYKFEGYG